MGGPNCGHAQAMMYHNASCVRAWISKTELDTQCVYRVFCPKPDGCGGSCEEYQRQSSGAKTQCAPGDKWPANMRSLKNVWIHDSGDSTAGEWIAGRV